MVKESTRAKGKLGEDAAIKYLMANNYLIIERNYKNRLGEIDLIARDGDTLVFVEVKARSTLYYGNPEAAVDLRKQNKIIRVALSYINEKKCSDHPCRFDVVSIYGNKLEVIKNAFEIQERFLW